LCEGIKQKEQNGLPARRDADAKGGGDRQCAEYALQHGDEGEKDMDVCL